MKVAHIALWTRQLETQARFWVDFFAGSVNEKYCSQTNSIIVLLRQTKSQADAWLCSWYCRNLV